MSRDYASSAFQVVALAGAGALSGDVLLQPSPSSPPVFARRVIDQPTLSYFSGTVAYQGSPWSGDAALARVKPIGGVAPLQLDVVGEVFGAETRALARIAELAAETSVASWDGERGQPVQARQWDDARNLVSRALREMLGIPAPFLSACGDGTAHLQWTTSRGDRGVIEIGKDTYWWSLLSMSGRGDELVQLRSPDDAFGKIRGLFG